MKKNCYLCKKKTFQKVVNKEIRGKVKCNVYQCQICNLEYLDKKFVQKFLTHTYYRKEYVKLYDKKFFLNENNHYNKIFDKVKNYTRNKKVLEIGAGGGYLYHYLKTNVKKYEAVELSNIQRKYLTKKFKIKTYKEIEDAPNNSFDVVIIISVLEHVTDPVNFLKSLSVLLKRKGKIIIECPSINDPLVKIYGNQSYKNFYYRPVHINYFNKIHLQKIVKLSGLKLVKVFSVLVYSMTNHLGWFFKNKGSKNSEDATNTKFNNVENSNILEKIFSKINKIYFSELYKNNSADMEIVICEKK
jgi:2-polyprenyl-3-methyl-5-hydroxy-6-metoxy-1,4-benzoquinol methylase|tara:strand:+ start:70 stop:972 length:903 start_codon:yes stop_codon:yes gene_type:complete